jgi:hypothetical protein
MMKMEYFLSLPCLAFYGRNGKKTSAPGRGFFESINQPNSLQMFRGTGFGKRSSPIGHHPYRGSQADL